MDPHPYPPPAASVYAKDQTWGIVVMVLSSLGLCLGAFTLLLGGAIGLFGVAATTGHAGHEDRGMALAFGGAGAIVAVVGVLIALSSILQVAGGVGIMRSRRWGFVLTGALAIVSFLLGLASLPHGVVHLAINAVIGWYCWARLSGKEGPVPA